MESDSESDSESDVYVSMDLDDDELYARLPEPARVNRVYKYGCYFITLGVCVYMIYRFR